jgi:dimeric dUTPase (all-alpha-NTP-PPase superfamily)
MENIMTNTNTITAAQVKEMFEMQDTMNRKVSPDWKDKGWDWGLAAQMELMEGVEHYGYKWWKKQTPDLPQVQLEVVDAFHFWLSASMVSEDTMYGHIADSINRLVYTGEPAWEEGTRKYVFFGIAQNYEHFITKGMQWADLLMSVNLTPASLYEMYVQKNVLNHFRQDHGYKTGEYVKMWKGEEDNVWLLRLSEQLKKEDNFNRSALYDLLADKYMLVVESEF